ncbi:MAG: hypothetical protein SGBAC_006277 [Bacillariaceae sp.]
MTSTELQTQSNAIISKIFSPFYDMLAYFRSKVYDTLILHMTTKWYEVVLSQLPENSTLLDVGVGTAGALINCSAIVKNRGLKIVGVDYDKDYVIQAQVALEKAGLQDSVQVFHKSVYDLDKDKDGVFDAVYFSGSFTLLPDPVEALRVVKPLTKSKIYVTQTYQRKSPPLLAYIKPLLRYLTTIDFGQLTFEADIGKFFSEKVPKECGLKLESHEVIEGSLDTSLQAAYLTILDVKS